MLQPLLVQDQHAPVQLDVETPTSFDLRCTYIHTDVYMYIYTYTHRGSII